MVIVCYIYQYATLISYPKWVLLVQSVQTISSVYTNTGHWLQPVSWALPHIRLCFRLTNLCIQNMD